MGVIESGDMAGMFDAARNVVCTDCITDSDEMTADNVILQETVEKEDDFYFCDRCKKQL